MADRKLFVGNLVRRITQEDLWVMYSKFGPLEECAKFHESFGFVRFQHAEDARQALKTTHGITFKGRCIKVEFAATTTSWRSASNNTHCHECRSAVRYNIPPIRAIDLSHQNRINNSSTFMSPPTMGPVGYHRKSYSKYNTSELNSSTTNSSETRQGHPSCSSPPSSYTASSSHITEIDDYDGDLDSGYIDDHDSPSACTIPISPWYDMPVTDELFIWDFQLYADIARELPLMKPNNLSFESTDDDDYDKMKFMDSIVKYNIQEYL